MACFTREFSFRSDDRYVLLDWLMETAAPASLSSSAFHSAIRACLFAGFKNGFLSGKSLWGSLQMSAMDEDGSLHKVSWLSTNA